MNEHYTDKKGRDYVNMEGGWVVGVKEGDGWDVGPKSISNAAFISSTTAVWQQDSLKAGDLTFQEFLQNDAFSNHGYLFFQKDKQKLGRTGLLTRVDQPSELEASAK